MTEGAFDVRWQPPGRSPRKLSFRPLEGGGWLRIELEWNGCQYREVGTEIVEDVELEAVEGVAVGR